jgi:hypothetical protein
MTSFLPDTNVWKHIGKDEAPTAQFEKTLVAGHNFLIGPPALIELVRGLVRGGEATFLEDRKMFAWMRSRNCEILDLTRPFMAKALRTNLPANSGVFPGHYRQLIDMVVNSETFDEFVKRCNTDASVWKHIESLDQIHESQIEKELKALEELAKHGKPLNIPERLANTFGVPGCRPIPIDLERRFSAAIEYAETSVRRVAQGAKPRKNNRGLYVDWQLLMYLANPDVQFLTKEDFSAEISQSPQKDRIVAPETLAAY